MYKSKIVTTIKYMAFLLFLICVFQKPQEARAAVDVNSIPYDGTAQEVIDYFDLGKFGATVDNRWIFIYIDDENRGYYFYVRNDNVYREFYLRNNDKYASYSGMFTEYVYKYNTDTYTSGSDTSSGTFDYSVQETTKYYYYANCDNITLDDTILPRIVFIGSNDEHAPKPEASPTPTLSPTPTPLPSDFMLNTAECNDKGFTVEKAFSVEAIEDVWNSYFYNIPKDNIANYVVYEIDSEHYDEYDRGVYMFLYQKDTVLYVERSPLKKALISNGYFNNAGSYSIQFGYRLKWNYDTEKWEYVTSSANTVAYGTSDGTASFGTVYASNKPIYEMGTYFTANGVEYYLDREVYNADENIHIGVTPTPPPSPTNTPIVNIDANESGLSELFGFVMQLLNIPFSINGYEITFLQIFIYIALASGTLTLIFSASKD